MILLECPFLNVPVRLSAEREVHILRRHGDLDAPFGKTLAQVLDDPDEIRWSASDESVLAWRRN
jgi:hypothetical protein